MMVSSLPMAALAAVWEEPRNRKALHRCCCSLRLMWTQHPHLRTPPSWPATSPRAWVNASQKSLATAKRRSPRPRPHTSNSSATTTTTTKSPPCPMMLMKMRFEQTKQVWYNCEMGLGHIRCIENTNALESSPHSLMPPFDLSLSLSFSTRFFSTGCVPQLKRFFGRREVPAGVTLIDVDDNKRRYSPLSALCIIPCFVQFFSLAYTRGCVCVCVSVSVSVCVTHTHSLDLSLFNPCSVVVLRIETHLMNGGKSTRTLTCSRNHHL